MITVNEIGSALYGAYRLARQDPGGMAFFDRSRDGALKSFIAAGLLAPFHALFVVTRWWDEALPTSPGEIFMIEVLTYVIAWTVFPVMMIGISRWIDRGDRFYDFVVAFNWSNVLVMPVRFPVVMIQRFELLPDPFVNLMALGFVVLLLVYFWYVTKTSLDIGGGLAAGLTATEYVLGLMLVQISGAMIEGVG